MTVLPTARLEPVSSLTKGGVGVAVGWSAILRLFYTLSLLHIGGERPPPGRAEAASADGTCWARLYW